MLLSARLAAIAPLALSMSVSGTAAHPLRARAVAQPTAMDPALSAGSSASLEAGIVAPSAVVAAADLSTPPPVVHSTEHPSATISSALDVQEETATSTASNATSTAIASDADAIMAMHNDATCDRAIAKLRILDAYASTHANMAAAMAPSSPRPMGVDNARVQSDSEDSSDIDPDDEQYSEADSVALGEILSKLQTQSQGILKQIDTVMVHGNASMQTLATPLSALNDALLTAASSLNALALQNHSSTDLTRRRLSARQLQQRGLLTPGQLSGILASTVGSISTTLTALEPLLSQIPLLGPILAGLDATLATTLTGLVPIVGGLLNSIGPLLQPVGSLLNGLGLGLVASLLGL